jgi:hypothetical protein
MDTKYPISKSHGCLTVENQTGTFYITIASWDTGYGPSYEVGLREGLCNPDRFDLVLQGLPSEGKAMRCAELMALALKDNWTFAEVARIWSDMN